MFRLTDADELLGVFRVGSKELGLLFVNASERCKFGGFRLANGYATEGFF